MIFGLGLNNILGSSQKEESKIIFYDSFNRADGPLGVSDSGTAWKQTSSTNDTFLISGNKMKIVKAGYGDIAYIDIGVSNNYRVTFDFIKNTAGIEVCLLPKFLSATELIQVAYGGSSTNVAVYHHSNSVKPWDELAFTSSHNIGMGTEFRAEVVAIDGYYTVKLANQVVFENVFIDAYRESTLVGFRMGGNSGGYEIDNIVVERLAT